MHARKQCMLDVPWLAGQAGRDRDMIGGVSHLISWLQNWEIPVGRRFRSLKLWFVLRAYGQEKLQGFLRWDA